MNKYGSEQSEQLVTEFEDQISRVISDFLPDLLSRAQTSDFSKWFRIKNEIDDLVQETAYRFYRYCKKHKTFPDDPLAYAVRIAKYVVYEQVRKAKHQPLDLTSDDTVETLPDRPEVNAEEDQITYSALDLERLRIAVELLPKGQRKAFELRNSNPGSTDKELGKLLNIGEDGFRKQFKRAFDRITLYLKD